MDKMKVDKTLAKERVLGTTGPSWRVYFHRQNQRAPLWNAVRAESPQRAVDLFRDLSSLSALSRKSIA
jgi:hypothetical protein